MSVTSDRRWVEAGPIEDHIEDERRAFASESFNYGAATAASAAGVTGRQLDYWARTGLVVPSVRATQSGTEDAYSFRDIVLLKVVKKLLDAGISLQNIRTAVATLADRGLTELSQITLMSDGTTIYECTSTDEVVDLLQGGQAVFAIAVGRHLRELEDALAPHPGDQDDTAAGSASPRPGSDAELTEEGPPLALRSAESIERSMEADGHGAAARALPREPGVVLPLRTSAAVARHRALVKRVQDDLARRNRRAADGTAPLGDVED